MIHRRTGGPAAVLAGPLLFFAALAAAGLSPATARAVDWVPPRPVTAYLPAATIGPGRNATIELLLRADGQAATVDWSAASTGDFQAVVTPSAGSTTLPANTLVKIPLNVAVPGGAIGLGSISITVSYSVGGGRAASTSASIVAATNGRPEIWPTSPTLSAAGATTGSVGFQIRSQIGSAETVVLTSVRTNPDPNNVGAHFTAGPAPTSAALPGGATVGVTIPVTLAGNAWPGSLNAFQMAITSNEGLSSATAFAVVATALPDSLPLALRPVGVIPDIEAPVGRDGAAYLEARSTWLFPAGTGGVRVVRGAATDSIGVVDLNADGGDDRLVGRVHIPSYAASLAVVPGFVAPSGDTLDLGLLAAGNAGLMLLDLRVIEDPPFGAWEDFFDVDGNGIDDRILRTIPMPGFATDVAWTTSPSGRVVAFVAAADNGSIPVSAGFDRDSVAAGTGAGIVAVDVTAAIDSLSGLPVNAGAWATPGNALDVELRGSGASATLAVADGPSGLAVADLSIDGGVPATVVFSPRAPTPLSTAWGTPYARDVAWIANSGASAYAAVATDGGGLQIARIPAAGAPTVVVAQETAGPPCGVAAAWTGLLGVAENASGVALVQSPGAAALDQVFAGAPAPYAAPVVLARGASWPGGGGPLEKASFANPEGGATAIAFEPTSSSIPKLFVSDRSRGLILRPGALAITAVEGPRAAPSVAGRIRLDAWPNPMSGSCVIRARVFSGGGAGAGAGAGTGATLGANAIDRNTRIEIMDVQGRVVRSLSPPAGAVAGEWRRLWDGRDDRGRQVASGRYWARVRADGRVRSGVVPIVVLR